MQKTTLLTAASLLLALIITGCASAASAGGGKAMYIRVLLSYDEDEAYLKGDSMGAVTGDGLLKGLALWGESSSAASGITEAGEQAGFSGSKAGYVISARRLKIIGYNADESNTVVTDWKGAEYLQFYVKNGSEEVGIEQIHLANTNGSAKAEGYYILAQCKLQDRENPKAFLKYQTWRTGDSGWTEQVIQADSNETPEQMRPFVFGAIRLDPDFEGFIRIPLSNFWAQGRIWKQFNPAKPVTGLSLQFQATAMANPGGKVIVDDIALAGSNLHETKGAVRDSDYF